MQNFRSSDGARQPFSVMEDSYSREGNLLSGHRTALDGGLLAECNMVSLTPFLKKTTDSNNIVAVLRGYESALAKILAVRHLNSGNGSLVKEIDSLNNKCPVRFGIDFVDTKLNIGVGTTRLARRMVNTEVPPCVFLGSTMSIVSATTSKFTASNGYPQISGTSTASFLDNPEDYPLFSRTTPSTKGHSKAIVQYLNELGVHKLALIYIADSYGFHYFEDLKEAVSASNDNNFQLEGFSLLPDLSNLSEAMEFVKSTRFNCVLVSFYGEYLNNHSLMEEAIAHGVAGKHYNTTWIFEDAFLPPEDWVFDASDPMVDAYKRTSLFTASGSGSLYNNESSSRYREFATQLKALANEVVVYGNETTTMNTLQLYLETMVSDPDDKDLSIGFWEKLLVDDTFLHPEFLNHDIPYEYESVIMAGLAICNSVVGDQVENAHSLFVDGEDFQKELVHTTIHGISGTVILDQTTGTRLQNSTYYTIQKLIAEDFIGNSHTTPNEEGERIQKTRFWRKKTAQVDLVAAIDEADDRSDENWVAIDNSHVIHDGGTTPPLPDIVRSPPPLISETDIRYQSSLHISMDENNFVRLIQGLSSGLPILISVGFIIWTYRYRNEPIVRASKPVSIASASVLPWFQHIRTIFSQSTHSIFRTPLRKSDSSCFSP